MTKKILKIIAQTFLLWVIFALSTKTVTWLHLPLPGSVLGMIVLFTLLLTGILQERWFSAATTPLLQHLSFFFIPIAVELMQWGDLFLEKGHLLFLPLVVSALVALYTTGGVVQLFMNRDLKKER